MKKFIKAVLLLTIIYLYCPLNTFADRIKVKIGAIASLTGAATRHGTNWLEGAQLAVEELASENILVDLITEDDNTSPAKSVSAFQKLTSVDRVQSVIGGTWGFIADAVAPVANRAKIPFVSPSNPVETFSKEALKGPWLLSNGPSIKDAVPPLSKLIANIKPKRVALVVPSVAFGILHADVVRKLSLESGATIVSDDQYDFTATYLDTIKILALKVASMKPDLVFFIADDAGLTLFAQELDKLKISPWLVEVSHLDEAYRFSKNPKLWEKALGIFPVCNDLEFKKAYQNKFGRAPRIYAVQGYDALKFLARAHAKGIDLSKDTFETTGVCGPMKSRPGSHEIQSYQAEAMRMGKDGALEIFRPEK